MKVIYEKEIGGDGLMVGLYVEGDKLVLKQTYPLAKVLQPVTDVIDKGLDGLEKIIPGDWDKPMIESAKAEAKTQLIKILSE